MEDAVNVEVDIEVGPVKMVFGRHFHVEDFLDRRIFKPRELLECEEDFPIVDEHPDAMS